MDKKSGTALDSLNRNFHDYGAWKLSSISGQY